MRPRDVTFSLRVELPEWLYSLRRQLGDGGRQAPPETLGPITGLAELRAVAHGTTGVKVYKADITRYRRYVEGFDERFDGAVRTQVQTLTGKHPWPA